jgi:hypothetical protein
MPEGGAIWDLSARASPANVTQSKSQRLWGFSYLATGAAGSIQIFDGPTPSRFLAGAGFAAGGSDIESLPVGVQTQNGFYVVFTNLINLVLYVT